MDAKLANSIFRYDRDSGKLYWRIKPGNRVAVGSEITSKGSDGYLTVQYKRKGYRQHRIIWLICYGKFPDGHIDHQDHNRSNNMLDNLRDVSQSSNNRNLSLRKDNTSGVVGVSFYKPSNKWRSEGTTSDGIKKYIGLFDTKEEAIEAREAFNRENGYHPNHGK